MKTKTIFALALLAIAAASVVTLSLGTKRQGNQAVSTSSVTDEQGLAARPAPRTPTSESQTPKDPQGSQILSVPTELTSNGAKAAYDMLKKRADQGDMVASRQIAQLQTECAEKIGFVDSGKDRAFSTGDPGREKALRALREMTDQCRQIPESDMKAWERMWEAAKGGDEIAIVKLRNYPPRNQSPERQSEWLNSTLELLNSATERGNSGAYIALAEMSMDGQYVEKNWSRAKVYFTEGARLSKSPSEIARAKAMIAWLEEHSDKTSSR